MALRLTEIFFSLQGEASRAGLPTVFVRLTGCPLRCTWCDTVYAFTEGRKQSLDDILDEVRRFGVPLVEVTGGEPLLQSKFVMNIFRRCHDLNVQTALDTAGLLGARLSDDDLRSLVSDELVAGDQVG